MTEEYLRLGKITFKGPESRSALEFKPGVNVLCGASETGKSFLAESIDFMLGASDLREISELAKYAEIELDLTVSDGEAWRLRRATSGGNFSLVDLKGLNGRTLKQAHAHDKTDNLSGFLLEKIGLLGKRILKSSAKGTTRSLSFRDLARLVIVQETEIQQRGSPFWTGQYTTKTSELATVKLLLTGVDDSAVVPGPDVAPDNAKQIALIDELLADLRHEIEDVGEDREELSARLALLEESISMKRESLDSAQQRLDSLLEARRTLAEERSSIETRISNAAEMVARFDLLHEHYTVDIERLTAIRESGSLFAHVDAKTCPVCGASPEAQHLDAACDGDVDAIVMAASSEIAKITRLVTELVDTVADLHADQVSLKEAIATKEADSRRLDASIQEIAPDVRGYQTLFSELVESRAEVHSLLELFGRRDKLEARRLSLLDADDGRDGEEPLRAGIPDSVAHALSKKVSAILTAWDFPGECHVYFDKQTSDFVIDGRQRASRGKGLRAITHAAVNIALLEFCQERGLPHPGFVVLDSPLLAYFKPEGDDDFALKGTGLKERFYEYLVDHHGRGSQIVIIENQHPPEGFETRLTMTVFTRNPEEGRYGFL